MVTVWLPSKPFFPYGITLTARQSPFCTKTTDASSSPPPNEVPCRLTATYTEPCPTTVLVGIASSCSPALLFPVNVHGLLRSCPPGVGLGVGVGVGVGV